MIVTQPISPSPALQTNRIVAQIDQDPKIKEMDSEERPEVVKRSMIQINVYSKGKTIRIKGKQRLQKGMDQQKVKIKNSDP